LGLGVGAGIIAAAITFIGGGLGFAGVFADACHAAGATAAQCTLTHVFGNLGDGVRVAAGTLGHIPAVIAAQPRAYDGLLTEAANLPFPDMQWYTPLFAWWLPQRTILYGFATALTVLLLVFTALAERSRALPVFIAAGVLVGVLPLVHAQTFIALAIVLVVIALFNLRREWLVLGGVAGVIALPRLVQIALAPHGSPAFGNAYPWLEPGWLSNAVPHTPPRGVLELFGYGVGGGIRSLLSPSWWGFWFINLGVAVPLSLATVMVAALRLVPGATAAFAKRVLSPVPEPLLQLVIAASLVFLLCNVVVLQSWDWDNTKLFAFWYLAAGLLIAATASWLWRRGVLRRIGASLLVTMTLLTGVVVLLRFVPWTPPQNAVGGPYTLASADERSLAAALVARTPGDAVFLTYGRPNDPVLAVAGRTGLLGYYGWLWSYGIDFGTRVTDVQTMYRGCAQQTDCPVPALLRKYHVSFVEIDDRADSPGAIEAHVDAAWWSSQGFPVVASSQHIVVYDVRRL
ncbi:MAG TPA: hypothetical protein VJU79_00795, partial [Candidatus Dormibacteraeota bacterium]|nr:hypothetical protein [Candidatus Dormibacteraeota bacterium]